MMKKLTLLLLLETMMMPMTVSAQSADAITWDFESEAQFNEWTIVDKDGDGHKWQYYNNTGIEIAQMTAHSGLGLVASASYDENTASALTPDNWLISPEVTLGGALSFWARGQSSEYDYEEVFGVYVCVGSSTNPDDFVQVGMDKTATNVYTEYTYDLSGYAGQRGRFAIRHYNCSDKFYLDIDDVCLDPDAIIVPDPTNPSNLAATPAATTADVTWNNASGNSWNLRYKVNNPNEVVDKLWDFTVANYDKQLDEGWGSADRDDDGHDWAIAYGGYDPNEQLGETQDVLFFSVSYDPGEGDLSPNNWLLTPTLKLGGTFKFWAQNDNYEDVLGVYVVTDEGEFQIGADFIPPTSWQEYSFDTSAYDGKEGRIAIVHHNTDDGYYVYVDYISYYKAGDAPAEWVEVKGLTTPNYTIEGLQPGTSYMVEVQAYTEKGATGWTAPTYFTTGINVSVSAVGYSTLYYSDKNLVVPEGVEASAITVEGSSMTKSKVYAPGDIIPQGTGVLIQAPKSDYVFGVTKEEGTAPTANMLRGSDEAEVTTGGDIYLMLSLNAKKDPNSVGFYYGAANGAPFVNGAHKAYLALTKGQAAGAKYVWFDTTDINGMKAAEDNSTDVYTITGVRAGRRSDLPKGIYIVGGKKIVVK